jgi:radical SAM-linked protein
MEVVSNISDKKTYRAHFKKLGIAAYVSHLDVMRVFTRALRRAKIPVWYTQGFTKRPYLDFPFPLPLGVEGTDELMDFALTTEIEDTAVCVECINNYLPEGFEITQIETELADIADIEYAEYRLQLPCHAKGADIEHFLSQETIPAEKFSKKKGTIQIDLKPLIKAATYCDNEKSLKVVLPVGQTYNINVNVFINALASNLHEKPESICAKRTKYYPKSS